MSILLRSHHCPEDHKPDEEGEENEITNLRPGPTHFACAFWVQRIEQDLDFGPDRSGRVVDAEMRSEGHRSARLVAELDDRPVCGFVAWIDADDRADGPSSALREHEVDIEEIGGIADENQREEEHPDLRVRELQPRLP